MGSDQPYGLEYQIYVLRQMLNQLPEDISIHMIGQLDKISTMIQDRQKVIHQILPQLEDIMLNVKYLEFDRQATALERDRAIDKLKRDDP